MSVSEGGFTLQGTIIDDFHNPVSGATAKATKLKLTDDEQLLPSSFETTTVTDAKGSYTLGDLRAGMYRIEVEKEEHESSTKKAQIFTRITTHDFKIRKQLTLTGVVYDTDGETPVFEANVTLEKPSGESVLKKTDSNGEFTVEKLYRSEVYTIKAFYEERQVENQDVRLEKVQQPLKLVLPEKKQEKPLFSIDLKFKGDLDSGRISKELLQKFRDNVSSLSQDISISIKEEGRTWEITDNKNQSKYRINREEGKLNIYRLLGDDIEPGSDGKPGIRKP